VFFGFDRAPNSCFLAIYLPHLNSIVMKKGTVKFFNNAKGFGFIIDEEDQKEHFVHVSGLVDKIKEGDQVEFELTEGKNGLNAINVKLA